MAERRGELEERLWPRRAQDAVLNALAVLVEERLVPLADDWRLLLRERLRAAQETARAQEFGVEKPGTEGEGAVCELYARLLQFASVIKFHRLTAYRQVDT
jgi:hypothetical protein